MNSQKNGEGQFTDKQLRCRAPEEKRLNPDDMRHLAIKSLFKNLPVNVDDKLATVKVARHVDKDRFQSAFRRLMGSAKK